MNLKDLSVEKLQALAYEQMKTIELSRHNLSILEKEIAYRQNNDQSKTPSKKENKK